MPKCVVCAKENQTDSRCSDTIACIERGIGNAQQEMDAAIASFFTENDYAMSRARWIKARDTEEFLRDILVQTEAEEVNTQEGKPVEPKSKQFPWDDPYARHEYSKKANPICRNYWYERDDLEDLEDEPDEETGRAEQNSPVTGYHPTNGVLSPEAVRMLLAGMQAVVDK